MNTQYFRVTIASNLEQLPRVLCQIALVVYLRDAMCCVLCHIKVHSKHIPLNTSIFNIFIYKQNEKDQGRNIYNEVYIIFKINYIWFEN